MICRERVMPKRNPMFHRNEMEVGDGRSRRELFISFVSGISFTFWFFIRMRRIRFG